MSFKFHSPDLPVTIRGARTLVWTMAAIIMLVAVTSLIFGFFFGANGTITYGPIQASGSVTMVWGLVFAALSILFAVLGFRLASLTRSARNAVVVAEVVIAAFTVLTAKTITDGMVITVLAVATIVLLFVPSAQAAFAGEAPAPPAAAPPEPSTPPDAVK